MWETECTIVQGVARSKNVGWLYMASGSTNLFWKSGDEGHVGGC